MMELYQYRATVDRVIDGDTIDVDIDLGFRMSTHQRLRLLDVNAPEVRGEEKALGIEVQKELEDMLPKDGLIWVETYKTGKYGRWLATIMDSRTATVSINSRIRDYISSLYTEEQ